MHVLPPPLSHRRELEGSVLTGLASLCFQLIAVRGEAALTRTRLFQLLALSCDLFAPLWITVTQLSVARSFGYVGDTQCQGYTAAVVVEL